MRCFRCSLESFWEHQAPEDCIRALLLEMKCLRANPEHQMSLQMQETRMVMEDMRGALQRISGSEKRALADVVDIAETCLRRIP